MLNENFILSEGLTVKTAGFGQVGYDENSSDVLMEAVFTTCEPILYSKKILNGSIICAFDKLEVVRK